MIKMIYNKQSLENFEELISKNVYEYKQLKDTYKWDFAHHQEAFGEISYFLITNKMQSTKIVFDPFAKMITVTNFYDLDIERIQKLKEGL